MFAEGKPLGSGGIRWLKIHLSNLYGYDKASFDDREIFATQHMADIYDSAENPISVRTSSAVFVSDLIIIIGPTMVAQSR